METIFDRYSDLFIDNEYFYQYRELCSKKATQKIKLKTDRHHIIPKGYFKLKGLCVDNSHHNLVNLLHKDHILAHYYLSKCVKDEFIYSNEYALFFMLNNFSGVECEEDFINELNDLQLIHEDFCRRQSDTKLGSIPWNKGKKMDDSFKERASESHIGKKQPVEVVEKRAQSMLGKNTGGVYVNNGAYSKHIPLEELKSYLDNGWYKGQIQKHKNTLKNHKTIHLNGVEKRVPENEVHLYVESGWQIGRAKKVGDKISQSNKGRICSTKGTKYVTDGITSKRISEKFVKQFLTDNPQWKLGRK